MSDEVGDVHIELRWVCDDESYTELSPSTGPGHPNGADERELPGAVSARRVLSLVAGRLSSKAVHF
jgi:hypothetical protein